MQVTFTQEEFTLYVALRNAARYNMDYASDILQIEQDKIDAMEECAKHKQ